MDKQILMDTETGSMNISQDAQQKIIRLRYLALHRLGTHLQQFTEKSSMLVSLCITLLFVVVNFLKFCGIFFIVYYRF